MKYEAKGGNIRKHVSITDGPVIEAMSVPGSKMLVHGMTLVYAFRPQGGWKFIEARAFGHRILKNGAMGRSELHSWWFSEEEIPSWVQIIIDNFLPK